jgi:hypothetical protein
MRLFSLPANPASKGRTTGLAASSRESLVKTRWRDGGRYVRSVLLATSRLGAAPVNGGCRPRGCGAGLGNARPTPLGTRPRFRLRAADASRSGAYPPDLVAKDAWQGLRYPVNTSPRRRGRDTNTPAGIRRRGCERDLTVAGAPDAVKVRGGAALESRRQAARARPLEAGARR